MCSTCKEAGDYNRRMLNSENKEDAALNYQLSLTGHQNCEGHCDCQHRTGVWVVETEAPD